MAEAARTIFSLSICALQKQNHWKKANPRMSSTLMDTEAGGESTQYTIILLRVIWSKLRYL